MNKSNKSPSELLQFAYALHETGDLNGAAKIYRQLIEADPGNLHALHYLGVIEASYGNYEQATRLMARSVATKSPNIQFIENYAAVSCKAGDYEAALKLCEQGFKIQRAYFPLIYMSAVSLFKLNRLQESLAAFDKVLSLQPNHVIAINERGSVLAAMGRFDEALPCFDKALSLNPQYADAALNKGNLYSQLKRHDEALAALDRALTLKPDLAEAWLGRGNLFNELKRHDEALVAFDSALTLKPDLAEAWLGRGNAFIDLKRYDEAFAAYDKALGIKPNQNYAESSRLHAKMHICDWSNFESECSHLISAIRAGAFVSAPFPILAVPSSPADQLQCAKLYSADMYPPSSRPLWRGERYSHDRIRVAYLSADFRDHPVSYLLAGLFEHHDRERFETIAVSFGTDSQSEMRKRLKSSFERFSDVQGKTDLEVARWLRELEVDIAVDLMGHTADSRTAILAFHPVPIQACFLGYLGTTGANYIDYFIGDPIALPFDQQLYYTEKIVHLPDCFMPTDSKQSVARDVPARSSVGLPEGAFVFCSFNENYKITAPMFDIWMRLLHNVEDSVLWLLHYNSTAMANLRREAEVRGVASHRLIFAPRLGRAEHLARISLADLFLNTHPVNAGATAIDALSIGLPIVTYVGETFVQRVTASLLHAAGLPELVVNSLEDYEALALRLARNPAMLTEIKAKLVRSRDTDPLFNTARFTRHIEAAYTTMWERYQRGEPPASFAVEPIR